VHLGVSISGVSIFVAIDESRAGSSRFPLTRTVSPEATSRPPISRTVVGSCSVAGFRSSVGVAC
jgi:hypothetical protein